MEKILVTGSAGFIGFHLTKSLLKEGYEVFGIDNLNKYYSLILKNKRLEELNKFSNFCFRRVDIADNSNLETVFKNFKPNKVVNLAAQAGVRYSIKNPRTYIRSNIVGFANILECCRNYDVSGLIYASSSSVYGGNKKTPFSIKDSVDQPVSLYASTKRSNELMAHVYSHLYGLNSTGLRYFTVYGPWGRPDMAIYLFTENIIKGKPIRVFNYGRMQRDFTYIDDVVNGTKSSLLKNYSCEIFNIGNNKPEKLLKIIQLIEKRLSKKAIIKLENIQPGDVKTTYADIDYSKQKLNFSPSVSIEKGISLFTDWYKKYNSL